jgi:ADP-ribosylglycohydrolase
MRVAPIGLLPLSPDQMLDAARDSALPTHARPEAVTSACAIAASVAEAATAASSIDSVVQAGQRAATRADAYFPRSTAGHQLAEAIGHAVDLTKRFKGSRILDAIAEQVGTSVLANESVPAAVAMFAAAGGDPLAAAILGTNLGGDTDTIASMAAAMAGAFSGPDTLQHLLPELGAANHINFEALAARFADATQAGNL